MIPCGNWYCRRRGRRGGLWWTGATSAYSGKLAREPEPCWASVSRRRLWQLGGSNPWPRRRLGAGTVRTSRRTSRPSQPPKPLSPTLAASQFAPPAGPGWQPSVAALASFWPAETGLALGSSRWFHRWPCLADGCSSCSCRAVVRALPAATTDWRMAESVIFSVFGGCLWRYQWLGWHHVKVTSM